MDLNKAARERMRELRLEKGISQAYIAKKLGFKSSQRYANIEYGTNRLTFETAQKVANILDVDVNYFSTQKLNVTSNSTAKEVSV